MKLARVLAVALLVAVVACIGYGIYLEYTGNQICGNSTCLQLHDAPGAQPQ